LIGHHGKSIGNQLFDSLRGGSDVRGIWLYWTKRIISPMKIRGHVWEEAIILTPPRIRLLLLSATIEIADEFAAWIEKCGSSLWRRDATGPGQYVTRAFLLPDKRLLPLLNEAGKIQSRN